MFQEFRNQTFTPGDTEKVRVDEANTDFSVDESSVKIEFGINSSGEAVDGTGEYLDIAFDPVDLSEYEEVSFHLYIKRVAGDSGLLRIELDGSEFLFKKTGNKDFNLILIDCEAMGTVSTMRITSLVENLTLFIDILGCRKTGEESSDTDILTELAEQITLDYGVETGLSDYAVSGSRSISLRSTEYIYERSLLEISEGMVIEQVVLDSVDGDLNRPLENSFSPDALVKVLCPVVIDDKDYSRRDPVCVISPVNIESLNDDVIIKLKNGVKQKRFTGRLVIEIFIECTSKKKVLRLAREFNKNYGNRFAFILDGEPVDVFQDDEKFLNSGAGNLPRKSFIYKVDLQPVTISKRKGINAININLESEGINAS
jgi:hypothetical protein